MSRICLLSWAIFKYCTIVQFGKISLASYKFVLTSQTITLASIYAVPRTIMRLSSDRVKEDISGETAENLSSSALKNVYLINVSYYASG